MTRTQYPLHYGYANMTLHKAQGELEKLDQTLYLPLPFTIIRNELGKGDCLRTDEMRVQ